MSPWSSSAPSTPQRDKTLPASWTAREKEDIFITNLQRIFKAYNHREFVHFEALHLDIGSFEVIFFHNTNSF